MRAHLYQSYHKLEPNVLRKHLSVGWKLLHVFLITLPYAQAPAKGIKATWLYLKQRQTSRLISIPYMLLIYDGRIRYKGQQELC